MVVGISFSDDEQKIAVSLAGHRHSSAVLGHLVIVDRVDPEKTFRQFDTSGQWGIPAWSPDGRWVAIAGSGASIIDTTDGVERVCVARLAVEETGFVDGGFLVATRTRSGSVLNLYDPECRRKSWSNLEKDQIGHLSVYGKTPSRVAISFGGGNTVSEAIDWRSGSILDTWGQAYGNSYASLVDHGPRDLHCRIEECERPSGVPGLGGQAHFQEPRGAWWNAAGDGKSGNAGRSIGPRPSFHEPRLSTEETCRVRLSHRSHHRYPKS
ncbi:MAG: hypothetical protein WDO73_18995 [Ignavibacteriota bacterium]